MKNIASKQFAVIGLGRFGSNIALALYEMGHEVLAIDREIKKVQDFSNDFTHVVQADSTDENALREIGIVNFDVVIVAIGADIAANIMTTLLLKEMGVKYIVSVARNRLQMKVLKKIGTNRIVAPEYDMARRVAYNLTSSTVMDYIELSSEYSIAETTVPKILIGKTLIDADMRSIYNINVVAIKRNGDIIIPPPPKEKLQEGDVIVIVGSNAGILKLETME